MRYPFFSLCLLFSLPLFSQNVHLFVGTYTGTGSKGIYVYRFNSTTGKATLLNQTDGVESPSYLALSPNGKMLYACNETASPQGGGISAFRFDDKTATLKFVNKQSTGGNHPCYVSVDKTAKWAVAGNYSGGSVAVFPLLPDGRIQPYAQLIKHQGAGADTVRQRSAHVHATVFSPNGQQLLVPDLGIDKVMIYDVAKKGDPFLTPATTTHASTTAGSGPRHLVFHPNGKWAYLVEELSGSVVHYQYQNGKLMEKGRVLTHASAASGPFGSADIQVSADGKFVYASNRGSENNIAVFKVGQTGGLQLQALTLTNGVKPRNFCIDPGGNFLLVANQDSDNIVVFKRNKATGLLMPTGQSISVPKPVCLKMKQYN